MNPLTPSQKNDILEHMTDNESELKKKFIAKNTGKFSVSVPHSEVEEYLNLGYGIDKTSKRKTKLTKPKPTWTLFEDQVWCMFYKLGFRILNKDEELRIQWGENEQDKQQIDVVAVGEDAIFVIECKAAETLKLGNFKDQINKMVQYKEGVSSALRQIYGQNKKVKFIFATKNYRFDSDGEDLKRLEQNNIFHLNDKSYSYLDDLINKYKETVKYQFYGLMFKNELISNEPLKIPVLQGIMGKHKYYTFSIEPSYLLKIGFVLHRTKVHSSLSPTYQRLIDAKRLPKIANFIDNGGYFPNSIIIDFDNSNEDDNLKVRFESIETDTNSKSKFGYLYIPNAYGIAYIIDGQHRLYGYARSKKKETDTIPIVAFDDMSKEEQLRIFMEINENQKSVSKNLQLDLKEDLFWDSPRIDSRMGALRSSIVKSLANDPKSVFYNQISIGEDKSQISLQSFDEALIRSMLIPKATHTKWGDNLDVAIYDTKTIDNEKAMTDSQKKICQFINGAYSIADNLMDENSKKDFLLSNRAVYAFIALLGSIHSYLIKTNTINPSSPIKDRINAVNPYITALAQNLNNMTDEARQGIKIIFGKRAEKTWLVHYEGFVHQNYPNYNPPEYIEYVERTNKELQNKGKEYKEDIIRLLKILVFKKLKEVYGDFWEKQITTLKFNVLSRISKEHGDEENFDLSNYEWEDYIQINEYKDLISNNWMHNAFSSTFAINTGDNNFSKRNEKIAWLSLITDQKGKQFIGLTRSDINKLEIINGHLAQFETIE